MYCFPLPSLDRLATYDQAKRVVLATGIVDDNVFAHAAAALCSGFMATVVRT